MSHFYVPQFLKQRDINSYIVYTVFRREGRDLQGPVLLPLHVARVSSQQNHQRQDLAQTSQVNHQNKDELFRKLREKFRFFRENSSEEPVSE
jgi:hypothetical protein